uniref:Uncharacterized protein n=1 Tax=Magallana gigas TaxID=29159 RepID=K1QK94_MAGGI
MFFYNIFIGIFSCLMRILKSIILGALFLPRLDHSTLPRKFQKMDPGFDAYCGFMHIESTHTNPVAMVFISILQAESLTSLKKNSKKHSNINLQDLKFSPLETMASIAELLRNYLQFPVNTTFTYTVTLPMDILKTSHRFSYAAAFGTLARLCSDIVFDSKYAFNYIGPTYLKVFIALVSMLIYGLGYFPLFAGITTASPLGYLVATLFSWVFTAEFFSNTFCKQQLDISYLVLIVGVLPEMLCFLYLSFSLPVRFVISIAKPKRKTKLAVDFESSEDLYESIRKSYQGIHVTKLFQRPPPPPSPPEGIKEKLTHLLTSISEKIFYKRTKGCFFTSIMVAFTINAVFLLHYLTSYRENLLSLYKGDNKHLTPRTEKSNASLVVIIPS